jgi:ATP-dependent DNA ligase
MTNNTQMELMLEHPNDYDLLDKPQLLAIMHEMDKQYYRYTQLVTTQGEVNRVVMRLWELVNKDGVAGASTFEEVYSGLEYAAQKIRERTS